MPVIYKKLLNQVKSDASLIRAYARGDASAFEMLYGRYKDILFNSLFHQVGCDQNAAEEIAQEVWMAVIKRASSFSDNGRTQSDTTSSFRSWLFSIAHRRIADFWRRQYKENKSEDFKEVSDISIASAEYDANEQETQQYIREIQNLLAQLPEEQRQSFILSEEGFSYKEIAEITESGIETVKSRLRYARKTMKQCLSESYD